MYPRIAFILGDTHVNPLWRGKDFENAKLLEQSISKCYHELGARNRTQVKTPNVTWHTEGGQTSLSKLLWTTQYQCQLLPLACRWCQQPTVPLAHAFRQEGGTLTVSGVSAGAAAAAAACTFRSCAAGGTAWAPETPWSSAAFRKSHGLSPRQHPENGKDEEPQTRQKSVTSHGWRIMYW